MYVVRLLKCTLFPCLLLCAFAETSYAQQSLVYTDVYRDYKTAMELFGNEKYATAQDLFGKIASLQVKPTDEPVFTYKSNSDYYAAICAVELDNPDAEKRMLAFVQDYPGNAHMLSAYYQLGRIYYRKHEYTHAVEWFAKVDVRNLEPGDRNAYKFEYAYSLFNKREFDQAKPLFESLRDLDGPYYYPSNYYYGFIAYFEGNYESALAAFQRVIGENPYSLVVPYYIANIYFVQKDYDKVISTVKPLIENTRLNYYPELNDLLGQAYFYKQDYTDAIPYLSYYIDKSRNERDADYYQLAFAQHKTGDNAGAISTLKETGDKNDTITQQVQYLAGNCYLGMYKKEDARNAFMVASRITVDPGVRENALLNYGKLSYELEYYTAAVSTMQEYMQTFPDGAHKTEAREILAEALLNTNDYVSAMQVIESIPDKTPRLQKAYQKVTYYSGVQEFNQKNYDQARILFQKSLLNGLDDNLQAAAYFWMGEIFYINKDYDKSINNHVRFQQLAKVAKALPDETRPAYSDYTIGYCYFKQKAFDNAETYFARSLSSLHLNARDATERSVAIDAMLRLADCYFMTKDYKKAETYYSKITENNAAGVDYALYQKGMLQGLLGKNASKISMLQDLIRQYPQSLYVDDAMYESANTYFLMKQYQNAIREFTTLLDSKEGSSYTIRTYLKLGLIYYNIKDYDNSRKYYKLAYDASPNSPEGREAKQGLLDIVGVTGNTDAASGVGTGSELDEQKFTFAKNKYDNEDYEGAAAAFGDYLSQFEKGTYRAEASFYRAECYFKLEKYQKALPDYEFIIENHRTQFLETSLLRASWIEYYQNKNYKTAHSYYQQLYDVAQYKENSFVAMKGLLRTAYFLNDYEEVITNAGRILNSDLVTKDEKIEADYYSGMSWLAEGNLDKAFDAFGKTAQLTTNAQGVEARFHMADILFQQGKLDDSKKKCLEIINDMPAYDEWVVRSYILLADIAAAQKDYAQAKATLNSIIDNYKGDQSLIDLAKQKLRQIEEMEKNGKKADTETPDSNNTNEIDFRNN